jgi:RND family efflux transporter MFP subunit
MKPEDEQAVNQSSAARKHLAMALKFLIPVVLIAAAALYAIYMVKTSPKSQRRPPERQARLVEVVTVERADVPVTIAAMGTVIPARCVELKPQVVGKIIETDTELIPGGIFAEGRMLMKIEPDDYELAVRQRESEYVTAQSTLKLEHGNQAVAEQEYKLLEDVVSENDKEFVLRKPQLAVAQSTVQTAEARLQQAKLDLERTNITAPFNAAVKTKNVEIGAMVSPSTTVVTLTGTDEYWIDARVKLDELKWIRIPSHNGNKGSAVRVYNSAAWGEEEYRVGEVLRLCPELEEEGRMAKLLISVKDPLLLDEHEAHKRALLLDSYVRVEIEGATIESAFAIDATLKRDNDSIWIFADDGTLEIRPINVLYRDNNHVVIVDGISDGERIVKTDIAAPVNGMPLALYPEDTAEVQPRAKFELSVSKEADTPTAEPSGARTQ